MKNVKKIPYIPMLIITIIFGFVYAAITNLFIDKLFDVMWKPLVVALYFLFFTLLLSVVIYVVAEMIGSREKMKDFFKFFVGFMAALFLVTMIFEVIYEIGINEEDIVPNSYIIVVDDSGSMETNDPQGKRTQAISDLVADKADDFEYAVYLFANSSQKVRDMSQKSKGLGSISLSALGGTYIGDTLKTILNDIESGTLKVKENTRLILLSDGVASDIGLLDFSFNKVLDGFVDANIVISTVGLGDSVDVTLMEKIAKKTGGVYVHADDAGTLSSAMTDASVYSSSRTLISNRGFCKTDVLHAIMRIVFLLIIAAVVNSIKITTGGESRPMHLIIGCVSSVVPAVFIEIALEVVGFGENFTRMIFCAFLAMFMVNKFIRIKAKRRPVFDNSEFSENYGSEDSFSDYSNLSKNNNEDSNDVQSLGSYYGRRKK